MENKWQPDPVRLETLKANNKKLYKLVLKEQIPALWKYYDKKGKEDHETLVAEALGLCGEKAIQYKLNQEIRFLRGLIEEEKKSTDKTKSKNFDDYKNKAYNSRNNVLRKKEVQNRFFSAFMQLEHIYAEMPFYLFNYLNIDPDLTILMIQYMRYQKPEILLKGIQNVIQILSRSIISEAKDMDKFEKSFWWLLEAVDEVEWNDPEWDLTGFLFLLLKHGITNALTELHLLWEPHIYPALKRTYTNITNEIEGSEALKRYPDSMRWMEDIIENKIKEKTNEKEAAVVEIPVQQKEIRVPMRCAGCGSEEQPAMMDIFGTSTLTTSNGDVATHHHAAISTKLPVCDDCLPYVNQLAVVIPNQYRNTLKLFLLNPRYAFDLYTDNPKSTLRFVSSEELITDINRESQFVYENERIPEFRESVKGRTGYEVPDNFFDVCIKK
jgi:hypothetical protein